MALITPESQLIVALDYPSIDDPEPRSLLKVIKNTRTKVKIGTEIAGARGWVYPLQKAHKNGSQVFADTKANDKPDTVVRTLKAHVFPQLPFMVNIHAGAGEESLEAFIGARDQVQSEARSRGAGSLALAVTVGSWKSSEEVIAEHGRTPLAQSVYYADMAVDHGFDGIVCSTEELAILSARKKTTDLIKVAVGIRPVWAQAGDQVRMGTPAQAIRLGASYIVLGSPITFPPSEIGTSANAIEAVISEIESAR